MGSLPSGAMTPICKDDQGTVASQQWQLWSNASGGCITLFPTPAFSASWANSGDFLARTGIVWQSPAAYTTYGTITAQFAESKTGTAGGFSYIGIYGWSLPPTPGSTAGCVEWYIVDDSYNRMPVNGGGMNPVAMGTGTIDGAEYTFYKSSTTGTGGNNCGSASQFPSWTQYYSVRKTARQCGQITITDHFNAWAGLGMTLGNLQEAQVIIEAGGGTGSIDFPTASVTATQ